MYSKCGVMSRRNKILRLCCQRRFRELAEFRGIFGSFRQELQVGRGLSPRPWFQEVVDRPGAEVCDRQAGLADENYR